MSFRSLAARAGAAVNAANSRSLRASFQPTIMGARQLSTEAQAVKDLPGDEPNDVVFQSKYGLRTILLNRPKKLNSLNASMIRKIVPRLIEWEKSDLANVIVMKGAGPKALCAGGDVMALAQSNHASEDGWKASSEYFALEYKLDHYIATYKKPYVAFMDGITMGGGVGLSIHAPFRIATEKTVFAMPETKIGFFPDVGASFFLPRMNGSIGTYLALTSDRLTGPNVFYSGLATHYLHSSSLPDLEARLAELRFRDSDDLPARLALINSTLEEFSTGLPYDQTIRLGGEIRKAIDRCFNKDNVNEIIAALEAERGPTEEWAQKQLVSLQQRSPTSVHVALRQMRVAGKWDIAETFKKEHQIATKFMKHPDFVQGVFSLLGSKPEDGEEKSAPEWQPKSLEAVGNQNVSKPFFEFDDKQNIELFADRTYSEYPYSYLGVPTEKEIKKVLKSGDYTQEELARTIIVSRNNRQGISDVVNEIISRKTEANAQGLARWVNDEAVSTSRL